MGGLYKSQQTEPRNSLGALSAMTENPNVLRQFAAIRANKAPVFNNAPQTWGDYFAMLNRNLQQNFPTDPRDPNFNAAIKNVAGTFAPMGITVFHGSPHKFDAFDMSKIGTGEGAQAYGHGLYFAENPAVASGYKETLTARKNYDPSWWADKKLPDFISLDEQRALLKLQEKLHKTTRGGPNLTADETALFRDLKGKYDSYHAAVDAARPTGALYKVDLPDDQVAKMLDWDKPLSQQSDAVRKAFADGMKEHGWPQAKIDDVLSTTDVRQALNYLMPSGNQAQASATLRKYGIPGIRYLDGGSRGTGAGTSNFVVFDDKLPKILGRE